jgi:prophage tail gpP-like protein
VKKARRPRTVCVRYQTQEVDRRNQAEALWSIGTFVEATIIVYGWFKPGTHDLWRPGEKVWVRSPMALLYRTMSIRMVTFTQDNEGGTRTTLDLVAPWQMNDESNAGAGRPASCNDERAADTQRARHRRAAA